MTKCKGNKFARFVFESSKINKQRVHFTAYQPPKNLELSVQTIDKLEHEAIVKIGQDVAEKRNQSLKGWAKIERKTIQEVNLKVIIDNIPIPGHAKIIGWPNDIQERKTLAQELARMSIPVMA